MRSYAISRGSCLGTSETITYPCTTTSVSYANTCCCEAKEEYQVSIYTSSCCSYMGFQGSRCLGVSSRHNVVHKGSPFHMHCHRSGVTLVSMTLYTGHRGHHNAPYWSHFGCLQSVRQLPAQMGVLQAVGAHSVCCFVGVARQVVACHNEY